MDDQPIEAGDDKNRSRREMGEINILKKKARNKRT
jgi:hypothetical protein